MSPFAYHPMDDVDVVEGGIGGLAQLVASGEWRNVDKPALLLARDTFEPGSMFYAFERDEFRALVEQLLADGVEITDDVIRQHFGIHEGSAIPSVPVGSWESEPALIVSDRPEGVVVPSRAPGAAPPAEPRPRTSAKPPDTASGDGAAAPDGQPLDDVVRRTPHIDTSSSSPAPGETFEVEVYADTSPSRDDESGEDVELRADASVSSFELQVWLAPSRHFTVTSAPIQTLVIDRAQDASTRAAFTVAVADPVADPAGAALTALFGYAGRPAGRVTKTIVLDGAATTAPVDDAPASLHVAAAAVAPDLTIEVLANPDSNGRRFQCKTTTRFFPGEVVTEPWDLGGDSATIVAAYMGRFTAPDVSPKQRLAALRGAGIQLFDAAPEGFRKLFWRLIDEAKPLKTVYVVSSEPYVPWELMVPSRQRDDNTRETRDPLGVEFAVGRWVHEGHRSPLQAVPLEDGWVVAPKYKGLRALATSDEEAALVCDRFHGQRIDPADFDTLDAKLAERGASLIHFVCHGAATTAMQSIYLEPGDAELTSVELRGMTGAQKAVDERKPLVFLNACEVGRPAPALIGVGGFAKVFIDLGARCVVAPLWSVRDGIAHEVATAFYDEVSSNPHASFADVVRRIRAKAYAADGGEDTYAAYCFYGDPNAAQQPVAP